MRYFFLFLFSFIFHFNISASPIGPQNGYNIVYNFEKDWITFDHDLNEFTPYASENNIESKVYSLKINLNDYPGAYLIIKTNTKGNFLFLDNKLKKTLNVNKWLVYSTRELINDLKKGETVLSIFGSKSPEENIVFIGYPATKTTEIVTKAKNNFLNLSPRDTSHLNSSLVFVFFVNILMLSFIASNYTKAFKKYFSLKDLTAFIPKENSFLVNKPMDRPNVMFVIMLSLISGFILLLAQHNGLNLFKENFFFQSGNTFGISTVNFFKVSLLVFISFIIKYFYINLIGKLFNIKKIVDIHYFKIIQTSIYYFFIFLIILLIGYNSYLKTDFEFKYLFTSVLFIFYFLRTALIYFTINRTGNVKTLYLISYLCIVELFPIVIGMRLLLE